VDHFRAILPAFQDPRYIKVDGRPIFYIYRPLQVPDLAVFVDCWQDLATREGLPGIYFIGESIDYADPYPDPLDAIARNRKAALVQRSLPSRLRSRMTRVLRGGPTVLPYRLLADLPYERASGPRPLLPCVISNWDNTPRAGRNGVVYHGATPQLFRRALENAALAVQDLAPNERLLFVKSWNEWAEGNYLEPDQRFGGRFLEAARDVLLS
jgi:hypothetical protein